MACAVYRGRTALPQTHARNRHRAGTAMPRAAHARSTAAWRPTQLTVGGQHSWSVYRAPRANGRKREKTGLNACPPAPPFLPPPQGSSRLQHTAYRCYYKRVSSSTRIERGPPKLPFQTSLGPTTSEPPHKSEIGRPRSRIPRSRNLKNHPEITACNDIDLLNANRIPRCTKITSMSVYLSII